MSGGSWDYVYAKFDDVAYRLSISPTFPDEDPGANAVDVWPFETSRRHILATLIEAIGKIMHEIEWYDSDDIGDTTLNLAYEKLIIDVTKWSNHARVFKRKN